MEDMGSSDDDHPADAGDRARSNIASSGDEADKDNFFVARLQGWQGTYGIRCRSRQANGAVHVRLFPVHEGSILSYRCCTKVGQQTALSRHFLMTNGRPTQIDARTSRRNESLNDLQF
ncbi:hypothetical protein Plhal703r1_c58g0163771 [Plasmopara halstedii]